MAHAMLSFPSSDHPNPQLTLTRRDTPVDGNTIVHTEDHAPHITCKNALRRVADLMRFACTNPPIDGLMRTLVSQTLMPFGLRSCALVLKNNDGRLNIQGEFGLSSSQSTALTELRLDSVHPIALALQTSNQVYLEGLEGPDEILGAEESILLLPILHKEEIFGMLLLIFQKHNERDEIDGIFFSIISNILTQASLRHLEASSEKRNVSTRTSLNGGKPISTQAFDLEAELFLSDLGLTPRQHEIAIMIANGVTNREIARKLDYSEATIRYETIKLYERLRVRNRSHAAARIRELKIN